MDVAQRGELESLKARAFDLHLRGALGSARQVYIRALILQPGDLTCIHLLGLVIFQQDDVGLALPLLRRAVLAAPDVAPHHGNLALALMELGRHDAALRATQTALVIDPSSAESTTNHCSTLKENGNYHAAAAYGRRAVSIAPVLAAGHCALGQALLPLGEYRDSLISLRRGICLDPANSRAWFALSQTSMVMGLPDAERQALAAMRLKPGQRTYMGTLAGVHKFVPDDEWLAELERSEAQLGIGGDRTGEVTLYFALGKAYDDLGQKERAFSYYLKGNALKRAEVSYHDAITLPFFKTIRSVFSAELIRQRGGQGEPSARPIFILGMPRSGTSLIEQVLASHSKVHGAGELAIFPHLIDELDEFRHGMFPTAMRELADEKLLWLARHYLAELYLIDPATPHVTDKMPGNLPFAGLIHLALPNARIILLRRNLVDVCLSCFTINFAGKLDYTYDLGELGRYARASEKLMDHWEKVLPADRLLSVRYEDFVEDQEAQTRRLLDFCGLGWEDACLSFHQTEREVRTASLQQVRKPIYKSSVRRWRPDEVILKPLLDALAGTDSVPVQQGGVEFYIRAEWCYSAGYTEDALDLLRRAVCYEPGHGDSLHLLGIDASRHGQFPEAQRLIRRALSTNPGFDGYWSNLSAIANDAGDAAAAADAGLRAVLLAPDSAAAWYNLGNPNQTRERFDQAGAAYARAVSIDPAYADARCALGATQVKLGRAEDGLAILNALLSVSSAYVDAHFHRGRALETLGRLEDALLAYRSATILDPSFFQAAVQEGLLHQDAGETQSALRCYGRALVLDPTSAEAWFNRSSVKTFAAEDPDISRMEMLLARGLPPRQQILMHFALGKAWLDTGNDSAAFAHFHAGNRLKREAFTYDVEADRHLMGAVAATIDSTTIGQLAGLGFPSDLPVFVLGLPRSGTTLVEQILASHPDIYGAGELTLFEKLTRALASPTSPLARLHEEDADRFLRQLGHDYIAALSALAPGKARVVDKLPGNFLWAGMIHLALPDAHIIHVRRDLADIGLSAYTRNFNQGPPYSYDLHEMGLYQNAYERLADHWRSVLPSDRYTEIRYERVVEDLEGEARRLLDFCGLPWDEACLAFHKTRRTVQTASNHQVRQPLYRSSVRRWERYASHIKPLLDALAAKK
jgi:tetratricopeptide (TPR) repeat protein